MRNIIFFLMFICSYSFASPNDIRIEQRNQSDILISRYLQDPNSNALLAFHNSSKQPRYYLIGAGLTVSNNTISASNQNTVKPNWLANIGDNDEILNIPAWAKVFNGSYASLTGSPPYIAPPPPDWNQLTNRPNQFHPSSHTHTSFEISDISGGVGRDLITAPSYAWVRNVFQDDAWAWMDDVETAGGISAVGLSNDYNDLDNRPALPVSYFSGAYGDLTGVPSTFTPAAHSQSWSTITSTPTTRSGYGITDAEPTIAAGTSSQYWRGDKTWVNFPVIPGQTSQLTNDSGYATSSYVNSQVATKLTIPTGTTSQVVLGNGTLGALPVPQAIQRTRVQTDASGNYTWTYPVAYGSGVVPIISAVSESASSTVPQGVQIVGTPTNTSATFKVINLPSTSVLSIVVLGAPSGSQAFIHLTAVAP